MIIEELEIKGCFKIISNRIDDNRGFFVKIIQEKLFSQFNFVAREIFYSRSVKNVIRGMHFQKSPFEIAKIIIATSGEITDVILDIRKNSTTFGKSISVNISDKNATFLFIPEGIAHGFKVKSEKADILYLQSREFNKEADSSIRYDSFSFDWGIQNPILSEKDSNAQTFENYSKSI
jgi:dTDP-4-dehydrorhamnose 3,5-epimerase/CDP-3, 6-dideoxy-D-glycero-D-glycero-4-hexulose-5-epimerase